MSHSAQPAIARCSDATAIPQIGQHRHNLRGIVALEVDTLAGIAGASFVGLDVIVELGGLLVNLGRVIFASLRLVDLQAQHLQLQLEHLVLDLADLQGISSSTTGGGDGIVEAAGVRLGRLGGDTGSLNDSQVVGVNIGQVIKVNLGCQRVSLFIFASCQKLTGNLALTSSRALPATPSETWKSA